MKKYIESEVVELKERYSKTIIKEIVSFLNADGGTIFIGVTDSGDVCGVDNVDETLREISDIITNKIEPNPQDEITSELRFEGGKTIIVIKVNKGAKHIYCQKKYGFSSAGCTIRIGTTCKEMTAEQIKIRYEQKFIDTEYMLKKRSSLLDLSFRELKIYYAERGYRLADSSFESNLNLRNEEGEYNLLAEILADRNNIPFIFVKFKGSSKASISERSDYGYGCLISTYMKIKNRLEAENISISDTTVRPRKDTFLFDYDAVSEAVINALVHNDWTITEPQISMFQDRMEILSHGGLPAGMNEKQFYEGISKPRNVTLMRIFLMMGLTEHTGHGIPTIINRYGRQVFEITRNYIRCTIPFEKNVTAGIVKEDVGLNEDYVGDSSNSSNSENSSVASLNKTQREVVGLLIENPSYTAEDLSKSIGVTTRTIERVFKVLRDKKIIERIGSKRDGSWMVVK